MFKSVLDVTVAEGIKKPNCFCIHTENDEGGRRVFTIQTDDDSSLYEWMTTVKVLAKMHNMRNSFKDKSGFADQYKHTLITACKQALVLTQRLTGLVVFWFVDV